MSKIDERKVTPVSPGKSTFNGLDDASSVLNKQKVSPSKDSLKKAHEDTEKDSPRLGQIVDILV